MARGISKRTLATLVLQVTLLMRGEEWNSVDNRNTFDRVAEYNHRVSTTNSVSNLVSIIIIDEVCTYVVVVLIYLVAYIVAGEEADSKKQK